MLNFTRKCGRLCDYQALQKRLKTKNQNRIVLLTLENKGAVPIGNESIFSEEKTIGIKTYCVFGDRIGRPIALGYINRTVKQNEPIQVNIAEKLF